MIDPSRVTRMRQLLSDAASHQAEPTTPPLETLRSALDDLDEMHSALEGLRDLFEPSRLNDDLNCVSRADVTTLLTVLLRQQAAIHARVRAILQCNEGNDE